MPRPFRSTSPTPKRSSRSGLDMYTGPTSPQFMRFTTLNPNINQLYDNQNIHGSTENMSKQVDKFIFALPESDNDRKGSEENDENDQEEQRRHRLFPWLVLAIAVNFLLWISMLYAVFRIKDYSSHRTRYLAAAWSIFAIPLFVTTFLLATPYPAALIRRRTEYSKREPSRNYGLFLNMFNAFSCFTFVAVYLYAIAVPQYNQAVWQDSVNLTTSLPIPSFAVILWVDQASDTNAPYTRIINDPDEGYKPIVTIYRGTSGFPDVFPDSALQYQTLNNGLDDRVFAYVFNSSTQDLPLANRTITSLSDQVFFDYYMNFNSTNYHSLSASQINMGVVFFDGRMTLQDMWDCGMVNTMLIPALAVNTFSLTVDHITDSLGLIEAPTSSGKCAQTYKSLVAQQDPPYALYSHTIDSTFAVAPNITAACDVAVSPDNVCDAEIIFSFSSQVVHSTESHPGISQLDIWFNIGAIVGGIQFFAWFLGIFLT